MDVDLLRPGTVPISPDTVLWFEFLLNEDLLLNHLQKPSCDPSPINLITTFFNAMQEFLKNRTKPNPIDVENGEHTNAQDSFSDGQFKSLLRNFALKVLSLKVAAHIKWNLNQLKSLPFKIQISLLEDLMYFTNNHVTVEIPDLPESDLETAPEPYLFALLLYHRWLLKTAMQGVFVNGPTKIINRNNAEVNPMEELLLCSTENLNRSLYFLNRALSWDKIPKLLNFNCFLMLKENSSNAETDWSQAIPISNEEFKAQVHYDLGCFFFYKENYKLATAHFVQCKQFFDAIKESTGLISVDKDYLEGYVLACMGGSRKNLLHQLRNSVSSQYTGIIGILQQDNLSREIPFSDRVILELDIQGAQSSGTFTVARDLLPKIQALNTVRCILDNNPVYQYNNIVTTNLDIFIWALTNCWQSSNEKDKHTLKTYCIQLIANGERAELLEKLKSNETLREMIQEKDVKFLTKINVPVEIPEMLCSSEWDIFQFSSKRNLKLEMKVIEQQIISTYNYQELRELLLKIATKGTNRPIWKINPKWELPIPLQSVLNCLPKGFLQDFGFVMLAKARELMLSKDWDSSLEMLKVLEGEVQSGSGNVVAKLSRLVKWEILLVQMSKLLEEWPAPHMGKQTLADECEACLQPGESVLPRTEVMEQCVICLLNLGRWDFLASVDKRWSFFEITAAIASSCHDFLKYKGNKKVSKDIWDLVLPVFGTPPSQMKRSGGSGVMHHDSPTNSNKLVLMSVFTRLRDSTALTIVISMLTRLYNVLRDESTLELQVDFIMLWPAVVSNANSYNTRSVCDVLKQIVTQALHYYPSNIPWLRLMGDINFANGHNESALNYYLKSLLISTDYFNLPVRNDDHVFRRMIKSCMALGCYTQAAVLCQFLEEPDYALAFHILAEQKLCNDAVDAYYHCFFDTNILEYLIHLHHKKGEFQRRKKAIQIMGLLELNSNNNEEILRETSNLRKSTFLRALTKQYVH